jgi:cytochrome c-type biogenesis protein CcmH/NrfF
VNFGRKNSQAIIGIQMAAAYTGSTLTPPLFGAVSAWSGLWILPLLLIVMAVLGLIMSERLNRLAANTVGASRTGA